MTLLGGKLVGDEIPWWQGDFEFRGRLANVSAFLSIKSIIS